MIKLQDIKLVLFDFDNTLCLHTKYTNNEDIEQAYDINILLEDKDPWENCLVSSHLKQFMELCVERNIKIGLISATASSKHAVKKQNWVAEKYGFLPENYCVSSAENKIRMMRAITVTDEIDKSQILLVDDLFFTLEDAANAGFMACSPMEVVEYMEELKKLEEIRN